MKCTCDNAHGFHWDECPLKINNPTTTGEWTPRVEGNRLYFSTGYWDIGEVNARTLEATINAALAAERESHHKELQDMVKANFEATEQLAAERSKVQPLVDALKRMEYDHNGHIVAWLSEASHRAVLAKVKEGK